VGRVLLGDLGTGESWLVKPARTGDRIKSA
jgi:hypothetical protein